LRDIVMEARKDYTLIVLLNNHGRVVIALPRWEGIVNSTIVERQ
jgi:hypothetical protein